MDVLAEPGLKFVNVSMLEGALPMWSETRIGGAKKARTKIICFEVALPVQIVDTSVAKPAAAGKQDVLMTSLLPLIAGHAVVLAWYLAMSRALIKNDTDLAVKLLEAALSTPIRLFASASNQDKTP